MIAHQQPVGGYPLAFLRFAQYAFMRLEMASFSAVLHVGRFCLDFVLGLG